MMKTVRKESRGGRAAVDDVSPLMLMVLYRLHEGGTAYRIEDRGRAVAGITRAIATLKAQGYIHAAPVLGGYRLGPCPPCQGHPGLGHFTEYCDGSCGGR